MEELFKELARLEIKAAKLIVVLIIDTLTGGAILVAYMVSPERVRLLVVASVIVVTIAVLVCQKLDKTQKKIDCIIETINRQD